MRLNDDSAILILLGLTATMGAMGLVASRLRGQRRRMFTQFVLLPTLVMWVVALAVMAIVDGRGPRALLGLAVFAGSYFLVRWLIQREAKKSGERSGGPTK